MTKNTQIPPMRDVHYINTHKDKRYEYRDRNQEQYFPQLFYMTIVRLVEQLPGTQSDSRDVRLRS